MRVLITNWCVGNRTGTEMYIHDLALELRRQGHEPAVFTLAPGALAARLLRDRIPLTDDPAALPFRPDVIHGHHYHPTMRALARFPGVPALFICHDHTSPHDVTPFHPRIRRYYGVSRLCMDRLRNEGLPEDRVAFLPNFVDLERFQPRSPLPTHPRRALLFSNYARESTQLPAVAEACRRAGVELDVVGASVGRTIDRPEDLLPGYDLVFAKAKAAMEAMAIGSAVVLCDYGGVGPLVTAAEFDELRPQNFGFQALREPLDPDCLLRQIERYDATDAARVRDLMRSRGGLSSAVRDLVDIYGQIIAEQSSSSARDTGPRWNVVANARDVLRARLTRAFFHRIMERPGRLARLRSYPSIQTRVWREYYGPSWFSRPF